MHDLRNFRLGFVPEDKKNAYYKRVLREDVCSYCGKKGVIGIDHIIPGLSGWDDNWMNLTAACVSCNSRKNKTNLLISLLGGVGALWGNTTAYQKTNPVIPENDLMRLIRESS